MRSLEERLSQEKEKNSVAATVRDDSLSETGLVLSVVDPFLNTILSNGLLTQVVLIRCVH